MGSPFSSRTTSTPPIGSAVSFSMKKSRKKVMGRSVEGAAAAPAAGSSAAGKEGRPRWRTAAYVHDHHTVRLPGILGPAGRGGARPRGDQIGRASCRESVWIAEEDVS